MFTLFEKLNKEFRNDRNQIHESSKAPYKASYTLVLNVRLRIKLSFDYYDYFFDKKLIIC